MGGSPILVDDDGDIDVDVDVDVGVDDIDVDVDNDGWMAHRPRSKGGTAAGRPAQALSDNKHFSPIHPFLFNVFQIFSQFISHFSGSMPERKHFFT